MVIKRLKPMSAEMKNKVRTLREQLDGFINDSAWKTCSSMKEELVSVATLKIIEVCRKYPDKNIDELERICAVSIRRGMTDRMRRARVRNTHDLPPERGRKSSSMPVRLSRFVELVFALHDRLQKDRDRRVLNQLSRLVVEEGRFERIQSEIARRTNLSSATVSRAFASIRAVAQSIGGDDLPGV